MGTTCSSLEDQTYVSQPHKHENIWERKGYSWIHSHVNISQECPRVMKGIIKTSEGEREGKWKRQGWKEGERGREGREKKEESMKRWRGRVVLSYHTWLKLSNALWRLASMPVGGSLVILILASSIPCGIMWPAGSGAGSADMYTRYASCDPSLFFSSCFSSVANHRATRWMF